MADATRHPDEGRRRAAPTLRYKLSAMTCTWPDVTSHAVSVVVPTYRRAASLRALLHSIARQDDPGVPWEVIVVDNEVPSSAASVVDAIRPTLPVEVRLVWEPTPGSAHARNRGIAEATGSIVVLVDDDVVAEPRWLAELVRPIIAGMSESTAGRVLLDRPARLPRWFGYEALGSYLTHFDLGPEPVSLGADDYLVTASAAFRADVLRATGGFDPELGPTGAGHLVGDDVLLHRKVVALGGRVLYVPSSVVVHELPSTRLNRRYLLRRAHEQGRSDWILERAVLQPMRLGGLRVSLLWFSAELRRRWHEGLWRPSVRFHLTTDLVRVAGNVRQMIAWKRGSLR